MWPGSRLKALTPSLIEWQHKRNCLFWPNNCGTPVIQAHYQIKPVLFPLSINNSHLHLSRWDKMSWARKHCDKSLKSGQVLEVSVKETRRQCRFPVCDQSCSSNLILLRPVCFTSHAEPRLRCFVDDIVLHILKSWQQSAWQWKLWMHHNYPAPAIWDALHSVNERTFSFMYFFFSWNAVQRELPAGLQKQRHQFVQFNSHSFSVFILEIQLYFNKQNFPG